MTDLESLLVLLSLPVYVHLGSQVLSWLFSWVGDLGLALSASVARLELERARRG